MLSFGKKIFITYFLLFIIFTSITFPIVSWLIKNIPLNSLEDTYEKVFLCFIITLLLAFSLITWFIINHLTAPIKEIIKAASSYNKDILNNIPEIKLNKSYAKGEFAKLALTLNLLSNKIRLQLNHLKDEKNEKELILESILEGVLAVDGDMNLIYANLQAVKFFNLSKDFLYNTPFNRANNPQSYALLHRCQQEKKPLTDSIKIIYNEKEVYLDIIATPFKTKPGAVLIMQDKSLHYKILEMKKHFIANASHELKTPITIIQGFAEILHEKELLPLDTVKEITSKIMSNCKRMTTLIQDLLLLSDIEHAPLVHVKECDLIRLIQSCCNLMQEVYPKAIIAFKGHSLKKTLILADESLIQLAFLNLIENGIKYSHPPAHIDISIKEVDNLVHILISDEGIGIAKTDIEHIFERFYTVDKTHFKTLRSSGLGLAIVQTIIHQHFGQVTVTSTLNKGSTFTVILKRI